MLTDASRFRTFAFYTCPPIHPYIRISQPSPAQNVIAKCIFNTVTSPVYALTAAEERQLRCPGDQFCSLHFIRHIRTNTFSQKTQKCFKIATKDASKQRRPNVTAEQCPTRHYIVGLCRLPSTRTIFGVFDFVY